MKLQHITDYATYELLCGAPHKSSTTQKHLAIVDYTGFDVEIISRIFVRNH